MFMPLTRSFALSEQANSIADALLPCALQLALASIFQHHGEHAAVPALASKTKR